MSSFDGYERLSEAQQDLKAGQLLVQLAREFFQSFSNPRNLLQALEQRPPGLRGRRSSVSRDDWRRRGQSFTVESDKMKLLLTLTLNLLGFAVVLAAYPNPITDDELVSVVTSSIDGYFYKVGSDVGTDKVRGCHAELSRTSPAQATISGATEAMKARCNAQVWDHRYDYVYSKLLAPIRREPIRLLEIGLGRSSPKQQSIMSSSKSIRGSLFNVFLNRRSCSPEICSQWIQVVSPCWQTLSTPCPPS